MSTWTHHLLQLHGRHWAVGLSILLLAVLLSSFAKKIQMKVVGHFHRSQNAGTPPILDGLPLAEVLRRYQLD